jgi:cellulose synthase (UDP-forming)
VHYPFDDVEVRVYLCDDGRRDGSHAGKENFKAMAEQFGIAYITRPDNKGFKAGNLNNAFWRTNGDLIVILDADTRLFPESLVALTGYFRNRRMAWVQSPQWFYDLPEGRTLAEKLHEKVPGGRWLAALIPFSRRIRIGRDIFCTDPTIFYNVILAHRNAANAAFCCGAASMHRRRALLDLSTSARDRLLAHDSVVPVPAELVGSAQPMTVNGPVALMAGPFVHHVSEDILTSILLHSAPQRWRSYQHPQILSRMLSPQNLEAYSKQFSRYAEGTFSIFFSRDNPLLRKGLTLRQRLAYAETLYSYLSPLWIMVFLLGPVIFYFTLVPPIKAFNFDLFLRFILLNIFTQLMVTAGHWGVPLKRSEQYYIGGFWLKLKALMKVLSGGGLRFNTTVKHQEHVPWRRNIRHVIPHLLLVVATIAGACYNGFLIVQGTHPSYAAFAANTIWATYNLYQVNPIIRAAFIQEAK